MSTLEEVSLKIRRSNKNKLRGVLPVLKAIDGYFVGGCVRDYILNVPINDIDIVSEVSDLEERLNDAFPNNTIKSCGASFGVFKMTYETIALDIAKTREEYYPDVGLRTHCKVFLENISFKEDMMRRDFTINALMLDENLTVLDLLGTGLKDLKDKKIVFIGNGEKRIEEDPLRSVRAIRFYSQLEGFHIEPETFVAIEQKADLTRGLSKERWGVEFEKILLSKRAVEGIRLLIDLGLLIYEEKPRPLVGLTLLQEGDDTRIIRYGFLIHQLGVSQRGVEIGHLSKKEVASIFWISDHLDKTIDLDGWSKAFKNREDFKKHLGYLETILGRTIDLGDTLFFVSELAVTGTDLKTLGILEKTIGSVLKKLLTQVKCGYLENKKDVLEEYVKETYLWK